MIATRETKLAHRESIQMFEDMMCQRPDAQYGNVFPLKHTFAPGIYIREIEMPAGTVVVGRIHKHEHPNFLMKGVVEVFTEEGGLERLEAPKSIISPAGTKRVVHVIEDCTWITVHATDETDIDKLEEELVTNDYAELPTDVRKELI